MARLWSWTGLAFAGIVAAAFGALYLNYLAHAREWFADLPLSLAALPFTLTMRRLSGGAYGFGGDMIGRVVAAALFCAALAYIAGLAIETLARAALRAARRPQRASSPLVGEDRGGGSRRPEFVSLTPRSSPRSA